MHSQQQNVIFTNSYIPDRETIIFALNVWAVIKEKLKQSSGNGTRAAFYVQYYWII